MSEKILPVQPVMDPHKNYVEINSYVVFWGLFMPPCLPSPSAISA